jgi:hypothetical protein
MLRRSIIPIALFILAGCQDYNFNPVGKCVIQPGSERVTLASASTADVLFVIDDSFSMDPLQENLSRNFGVFIGALAQKQADRKSQGLEPFEFHIAITTSSIFENQQPGVVTCDGATCSIPAQRGHADAYTYACSPAGAACGDYITSYYTLGPTDTCKLGVGTVGAPFPQGDFVAPGANSKVLHFTKDLQWETWGTGSVDPQLQARVDQFKQNVLVGSCGSGEEQHFESARLAVTKALRQDGLTQAAGVDPSEWPHPDAKMVVVWLGNEEECSNPQSGRGGGSLVLSGAQGGDTCLAAGAAPDPAVDTVGQLLPLKKYVDFFTGLGKQFGAAFIYPALSNGSGGFAAEACDQSASGPVACTNSDRSKCVGTGGKRFERLAAELRQKGVDTVEASVCDTEFSTALASIAELLVPVNALSLPSQPATSDVAVLRIESTDGATRKFCTGPGPDLDWDFVNEDGTVANGPTKFVAINHATNNCEANPGETYVAQYLGVVPEGGCTKPPGELTTESQDCADKLGGTRAAWQCFGAAADGVTRGTCVCQAEN